MAKDRKASKGDEFADEARIVVRMERDERVRLRKFCVGIDEPMESVARRWLLERLAQEEHKARSK